jgi:hypothetical protein
MFPVTYHKEEELFMKKKTIIFIAIALLSLTLVACTREDISPPIGDDGIPLTDIEDATSEESVKLEQQGPTEPGQQEPVEPDQGDVEELELPPVDKSELLPCISNEVYFFSQNEMTQQLKTMRLLTPSDEQYNTYSALNTEALTSYYMPKPSFVAGYDFEISWINPKFIYYAYETKDDRGSIEFEFCRIPTEDPLSQIEQRYGIRREDGTIFIPHQHTLYFVVDGSHLGLVRVGGSLDTGTLDEIYFLEHAATQVVSVPLNPTHVTE